MKPGRPVFLARQGYRLRRAMDAARFLPILGALLFLLPLLWSGSSTRVGIIYLFIIWIWLIILSFALSRLLRHAVTDSADVSGDEGGE